MPDLRHLKHPDSHLSVEIVLLLRLLVPDDSRCDLGQECPQCGEANSNNITVREIDAHLFGFQCDQCDRDYTP